MANLHINYRKMQNHDLPRMDLYQKSPPPFDQVYVGFRAQNVGFGHLLIISCQEGHGFAFVSQYISIFVMYRFL